jgi:hypothetical protein
VRSWPLHDKLGSQYNTYTQKIGLAPGHHAALYLFIFEIGILKFEKTLKKYVNIANYVHYDGANFYCEIPCIGLSNKDKLDKIWNMFPNLKFCYFC